MSGSFDDGDEPKMWSCIIGTGASFNGGVAVALHGDEIVVAGPSKILFVDARTRAVAATVDVETGASLGGNQMGRVDAAATWVEAGLPGCSCPMARSSSPRLVGYHHTGASFDGGVGLAVAGDVVVVAGPRRMSFVDATTRTRGRAEIFGRPVATEYPRRSRGAAATCLHGLSTS